MVGCVEQRRGNVVPLVPPVIDNHSVVHISTHQVLFGGRVVSFHVDASLFKHFGESLASQGTIAQDGSDGGPELWVDDYVLIVRHFNIFYYRRELYFI